MLFVLEPVNVGCTVSESSYQLQSRSGAIAMASRFHKYLPMGSLGKDDPIMDFYNRFIDELFPIF